MLQMSQIEKPRCSAKIDQVRLRCAMDFPLDFQNVSSSGSHSEIQVEFRWLISLSLSGWHRSLTSAVALLRAGTDEKARPPGARKASLPGRRHCLWCRR